MECDFSEGKITFLPSVASPRDAVAERDYIHYLRRMKYQIDTEKVKHLTTGEQHLTERYGPKGSASRAEFEARARAWYFTEILGERCREDLPDSMKQVEHIL